MYICISLVHGCYPAYRLYILIEYSPVTRLRMIGKAAGRVRKRHGVAMALICQHWQHMHSNIYVVSNATMRAMSQDSTKSPSFTMKNVFFGCRHWHVTCCLRLYHFSALKSREKSATAESHSKPNDTDAADDEDNNTSYMNKSRQFILKR